MTESSGLITWAYTLLTSASAVSTLISARVYDGYAPQNTQTDANGDPEPYIILNQQSYQEVGSSLNGDLGAGMALLLVKVVTRSAGFASAEVIYKAAHTALQGQTGTATGVIVLSCVRENTVRYVDPKDGVRINHFGGVYRIVCSPTA